MIFITKYKSILHLFNKNDKIIRDKIIKCLGSKPSPSDEKGFVYGFSKKI